VKQNHWHTSRFIVEENEGQIRDMEIGSEGKTCFCCGKSKKVHVTDAAIRVESSTCLTYVEQQIDMRSIEEVTLWRPTCYFKALKCCCLGFHRTSAPGIRWDCDCDDAQILIGYASGSVAVINNVKQPAEMYANLCARIENAKMGPKRVKM